MQQFNISPLKMAVGLWYNRRLTISMIERDIAGRYRGSIVGILWSFINPILLLAVYTFVFSVVFKSRWTPGSESKTEFALVLFTGLIVFNLFAECISQAPTLIISNTNYVKKVVFPLEILPIISFGSAVFHMLVSLLVWLIFFLCFFGLPPVTALLLPVVLLPISFFILGISWFLASIGVFLRDVGQVIGIVVTIFMFMTPIFYPITSLPPQFQKLIMLNPLALAVEQVRSILLWGKLPHWDAYLISMVASLGVVWLGLAWFQKTRKGFGDVL